MKLTVVLLGLALCHGVLGNPVVKRAADCGCLFDSTLNTYTYDVGTTWSTACSTFECVAHETVHITAAACQSNDPSDSTCYGINATWTAQTNYGYCADYLCMGADYPVAQDYACLIGGTCVYDNGQIYWDGCYAKMCNQNATHIGTVVDYSSSKCAVGADCYAVGESWTSGVCQQGTCGFDAQQNQMTINYSPSGCLINGQCYHEGDPAYESGCSVVGSHEVCYYYTCVLVGSTYTSTYDDIGCKYNSVPYPTGEWYLADEATCQVVTCSVNSGGAVGFYLNYQCKDSNNVCQPYGTNGWSYVLDGTLKNNCTCDCIPGQSVVYSCFD